MSKFFLSAFLFLLAISKSLAAARDVQVVLDNGDTLSGRLLSEGDGEIRLSVDYLGEISLPRARVTEIVGLSPEKPPEKPPAKAEAPVVLAETNLVTVPEKPRVMKDVPAKPKPPEPAVVEEEAGPAQKRSLIERFFASLGELEDGLGVLPKWEKNLQLGLDSTSGRKDQSSQSYRFDMQRKFESSSVNLKAEYAYSEANGSRTRDRLSSSYRWRKDIGPGVFYESESDYYTDQIKLIDSNIEQKLGLGTRFLDKKQSTLSAGLGASGRWRTFPVNEDEVAYLVNVFQDWDYKLSERVRVKQDFNFAMPLKDSDEYEINFTASLTSKVSKAIKLSVRYEFGFDNSLAEDRREDRRFVSSLGYAF